MVRVSGALPYVSLLLVVGGDHTHAHAHDAQASDTQGGGEAWRSGVPVVGTERHFLSPPKDSPQETLWPSYALRRGMHGTEDGIPTSTASTPAPSGEAKAGVAPNYTRGKRKTWQPFDPHSARPGEPGTGNSQQELIEDGLEDLLSLYPGSWGGQGESRGGRRRGSHGRHKLRHGKRRRHHPRTLLLLEAGLSLKASDTTLTSPSSPTSSPPSHPETESSHPHPTASSQPRPIWEHNSHLPVGTHTPSPASVPLLSPPPAFTSRRDDLPEKQENSSIAFPREASGELAEQPSHGGQLGAPPTTSESLNGPRGDLLQYSFSSLRGPPTEGLRWQPAGGTGVVESQSQAVTHEAPRPEGGASGLEGSTQSFPSSHKDSSMETPGRSATQRHENSRHDLRESNKRQTIKLGSGARHTSPMSPEAQPTNVGATHVHHKHTHIITPRPSAAALSTSLVMENAEDGTGRVKLQQLLSTQSFHQAPMEIPAADLREAPERGRAPAPGVAKNSPSITLLSQLATTRPDKLQQPPVPDPPGHEGPRPGGGGGGCYSTNDVVVVVFLTSLANMVAFVVVTVALCWCSLRARAVPPPRPSHPDDARQDSADDDAEETAVPEGCLEACLPDISYQRHIARGSSIRPSFVVGRALRPLVHAHSPRPLSHAVHELLHNLTAPTEVGEEGEEEEEEGKERKEEKGKKRRGCLVKRRSLSLENLMLT